MNYNQCQFRKNINLLSIYFIFFTVLNYSCSTKSNNKNTTSDDKVEAYVDTSIGNENKSLLKIDKDSISNWIYDSTLDKMDNLSKSAKTRSIELVYFDFPYNGGSFGSLVVRKKRNELNIIFLISKGQIDFDYDGTFFLVKFDDKKPKKYSISESSDGSTDIAFFDNEKVLLKEIRNSKKMVIEVPFYQNGLKQFEFNTANLLW